MSEDPAWQTQAVEHLSRLFDRDPDARAFILSGSLVAAEVQADGWSDVDAKIILADPALDRYYLSTSWLASLGQFVGAERHQGHSTRTLRVCLAGGHRFDLTFIAESAWQQPSLADGIPFQPTDVIIWSRLSDLATRLASLPLSATYQDVPPEEIERLIDAFWFKAALAVAKVVRDDRLIGLHLALDLARDSLVLQMIRRDRVKRTTIHRTGGWGNELVARFAWHSRVDSGEAILDLIKSNCEVFDELASEVLPGYNLRGPLLFPSLETAKETMINGADLEND